MPHHPNSCAGPLCALLALGAALTGCNYSLNDSLTIGDELVMPATVPEPTLSDPSVLLSGPAVVPPPSVTGVMRDNWSEMVFLVPIEGTEHRATSSVHARYTGPVARGTVFPTEGTVLDDVTPRRLWLQTLEGIAEPVYSGLDLVMAIPRMVVAHPWVVQESPREAYERAPTPLRPVVPISFEPEVIEEEAAPITEPPPSAPPSIPPRPIEPAIPPPAEPGQ